MTTARNKRQEKITNVGLTFCSLLKTQLPNYLYPATFLGFAFEQYIILRLWIQQFAFFGEPIR
jgi:hypothetical protein